VAAVLVCALPVAAWLILPVDRREAPA
jgi:hypothetical protein